MDFYVDVLELKLLSRTQLTGSIKIGSSILTIHFKEDATPYHFAFNIPSDQEDGALIWLKKRVNILTFEENEIADFKSWNAKSIYFYDRDNNIVEFISRKNLEIFQEDKFSSSSILNISEIGLATSEIERTFHDINRINKIDFFDGNFKLFCALGNDQGMFILVNPKMKRWFPTGDEVMPSDFILRGDHNFKYVNGRINEIS